MDRHDIPLEGELNCWTRGFDLPDLLLAVCNTGKTGLLRFVSSEAEKTLFIREGAIIFAKSSSVDDRLGEYLLKKGQLSLQDLSKLTHLVCPGKRLGALLVENGLLDAKELVHAVIGQVRAIILSLFRWTEAWYGFGEQEFPSKETITLDMPTARLILDGVQWVDSWRRIAQGVGEMEAVYRTAAGNEETLRKLDLDTPSLEILAILGRPMSVGEVCEASVLPDIDVCRRLWVFRSLGWIQPAENDLREAPAPSEPDQPREQATQPMAAAPASASLADLVDSPEKPAGRRQGDPPTEYKAPAKPEEQQVLDTVDLDIEGLGMVLGDQGQ